MDLPVYKAVGSNCFAGLIIKGFEQYFDVLASFEPGDYAKDTMDYNFPGMKRIQGSDKLDHYKDYNNIDLLFGNPICSGFSALNTTDRGSNSKQNWSINDFMDSVKLIDPTVFVYESVQGHWIKGKKLLQNHSENFPQYRFTYILTSSVLHGVPQHRRRFFCVGSKIGHIDFRTPHINKVMTVHDAISDLEDMDFNENFNHITWKDNYKHTDATVLSHLLPGKSCNNLEYDQLNDRMKQIRDRGKSFGFHSPRRIRYNDPSPTVYGGCLVHPVNNRVLTCREELRLMSVPDDFIIKAKRAQTSIQVGKSVPCNTAKYIASCIYKQLKYGISSNSILFDFNELANKTLRKHRKKNETRQQTKLFY